jgi:hypothetical protein
MTALRSQVLVALFCLFTLATSAHAECSWVMWKQPHSLQGDGNWELWAAYPGAMTCR